MGTIWRARCTCGYEVRRTHEPAVMSDERCACGIPLPPRAEHGRCYACTAALRLAWVALLKPEPEPVRQHRHRAARDAWRDWMDPEFGRTS